MAVLSDDDIDIAIENGSATKVVIVEDHSMVAEGFARIISREDDFVLSGVAGTVADAIALINREHPDVVLMDYHLPDGDGAQATLKILAQWPDTKVLMLSGNGGAEILSQAMSAGCSGFLPKNRPAVDVVAAVRAVARGELVLRSEQLTGLLSFLNTPASTEVLSHREIEVLQLLSKGIATQGIADELFLSIHTVRNHVRNILLKLGAHSMLEAVAIAMRDGLISSQESDM